MMVLARAAADIFDNLFGGRIRRLKFCLILASFDVSYDEAKAFFSQMNKFCIRGVDVEHVRP
ncbi:hypothetical protein CTT39_22300 [Agrobacterium rosae]|nr:hypothetical protein CTT39_22300 [Agrobacterium rosae]